MMRYARLMAYFIRFSMSRSLEFRFDFFFRVVMDMGYYAINLVFFGVLYRHVGELAGWTYDQAVIFVAGYIFIDALQMTFVTNNSWMFPTYVNRGDLDYYLIRPVSALFVLSLRDFALNSFINLLMTVGILAWALGRYPEALGAANIAVFVGALLIGAFINYCMLMLFILPVFWTHSAHGMRFLFFSTHELVERPHQIYPGWLRRTLLSVFPAAMIASLPTQTLFEGLTLARAGHFFGVAAGFFALVLLVWRQGLRAYSSASS